MISNCAYVAIFNIMKTCG